jgi:hypothetical protein
MGEATPKFPRTPLREAGTALGSLSTGALASVRSV